MYLGQIHGMNDNRGKSSRRATTGKRFNGLGQVIDGLLSSTTHGYCICVGICPTVGSELSGGNLRLDRLDSCAPF